MLPGRCEPRTARGPFLLDVSPILWPYQNDPSMNRRDFLKSGSAALAAAAVSRVGLIAAEAPAKKRDLKKGYMLGTFPVKDIPVLEKFKMLKAAGFDGVEPPSHLAQDEVLRARDG